MASFSTDPYGTQSTPSQDETDATKRAQMWQMLSAGLQAAEPIAGGIGGALLGSVVPVLGTGAGGAIGTAVGSGLGQLYGAGINKFLVEPAEKQAMADQSAGQYGLNQAATRTRALDELLGRWRRFL